MASIEDKIAKLLTKAEGTTNPHEAEAFMAKAEAMMLENGIERAMLENRHPGQRREDIIQTRVHLKNGHGYAKAQLAIFHAVAPSFSVRSLQSGMYDGSWMAFLIGHKSDVEQAKTLASSLMEQARKQALHWWKTEGKHAYAGVTDLTDNDAYLARREFIYAFASGVRNRLQETRSRLVEEATTGTELVLVERGKLVDNWIDENMKVGKARSSNRNHGGYAAAKAGRQAGRDAIGTKEVTR